jgi:hypothetical protein
MKWTRLARFILAALVLTGYTGQSALASGLTIYVTGSGGEFGTLDLSNPANITYQSIGRQNTLFFGMGFTSNGNLYGFGLSGLGQDLFQIDTANGSTTALGSVPPAIAATIGPDGQTMYELEIGSYGTLFTLTPPSARTTVIGSSLLPNGSDGLMAFSPNGTLYTDEAYNGNDVLAAVDLTTGVATLIGTGMGDNIFAGGFLNGTLFGFAPDGDVYTINTSTGDATFYGSYNLGPGSTDSVYTAAVVPSAVPEPSSLALVSIAAGAVSGGSIFRRVRETKRRH